MNPRSSDSPITGTLLIRLPWLVKKIKQTVKHPKKTKRRQCQSLHRRGKSDETKTVCSLTNCPHTGGCHLWQGSQKMGATVEGLGGGPACLSVLRQAVVCGGVASSTHQLLPLFFLLLYKSYIIVGPLWEPQYIAYNCRSIVRTQVCCF